METILTAHRMRGDNPFKLEGNNMNIQDALSILGLAKTANQDQIKLAYRKACTKYHPDRNPGGLEMMKSVNVAYQFLVEKNYDGETAPIDGEINMSFGDELMAAINAVIELEGVIVEICGSWVWLSGDTKPHKDTIKQSGFYWASKKMMWYFRPADYKSKGRGSWDITKIRDTYGSSELAKKTKPKLN
jgi:hypothetical protein